MNVQLTEDQARVLRAVLDDVLGDLSTEIADTDNPSFRASLETRRDTVRDIRTALGIG